MDKAIIVNATALRSGGALTILKQFLKHIPDEGFHYFVFINKSVVVENVNVNVKLVLMDTMRWPARLYWDHWGLKRYLKRNKIFPLASISLQNTNFNAGWKCKNYVYYHQSLPLIPHKWNFFDVSERLFWLYRYVYPFFVKILINERTEFFVQLEFVKELFVKKYNVSADKVHVIAPGVEMITSEAIEGLNVDKNCLNLLYPATPLKYKNHQLLFDSLGAVDRTTPKRINLYLTCGNTDFKAIPDYRHVNLVFLGKISQSQLFGLMEQMDGLVFPSCIETLGLPLLEAATIGLPILVVDLPYAREALSGYTGATFIPEDHRAWENGITDLLRKPRTRYTPHLRIKNNSWDKLFEILKQNIYV